MRAEARGGVAQLQLRAGRPSALTARRVARDGILAAYLVGVCVFSVAPLLVILASSLTSGAALRFPPQGVSLRWYAVIADRPEVIWAFVNSLVVALFAVLITIVLGTMAAYALIRHAGPGRQSIEMLLQSPLLLPSIVLGLALAQYFPLLGILVTPLQLILSHVILTFPYAFRAIMASLVGVDVTLEEAAWTLGATKLRTAWEVLLPVIKPGVMAGALFVFITSFDNVTVSLWMVGPGYNTFPMWLFSYVQQSSDPLPAAVATASMVLTVLAVFLLERYVGLQRYLSAAG